MFFKQKKEKLDRHKIVSELLSFILNDEKLSSPVYLSQVKSEKDGESLGLSPVVYIWNENREHCSFSVSVNGKAIGHLLEAVVPREHHQFNSIRDEAMAVLSKATQASIVSTCEKVGAFPSEIF